MKAVFNKANHASHWRISDMTSQANKANLPDPTTPLTGDWPEALHEPFVRQAKRVGEKMAVVGHDRSISYAELDRLSNQLAHYLCAHDCSGKVVAIVASRCPTLVWAMLGVLKAGAAFLILDSAYPPARLAEYCRQAKPGALLLLEEAGTMPDELLLIAPPIRLTLPKRAMTTSPLLEAYSQEPPDIKVGPDKLAYVMFTSGSTGKPKGILGRHAPPAHFMAWHIERFGFTESERFSMLSGLAHDIILRDIFTPLSLGATLYVPKPDDLLPKRISAWLRDNQITVAHLTPPMGQLVSADEVLVERLRYLFFGGDKLPTSLVEKLYQLAPNVTCVNFYGATETPQAMGYFIVPRSGIRQTVVPVGRGIEDVQLLVLTDELKLAGIEEVGEIVIRTPYLALGYLGDRSETSPKFISNPFTNQKADRFYRTGDLGRYLPDGNVELLGRRDHQVQIRGYRIELSEIEATLNAHPAIQQSVIVLREQAKGNYLVAYVVASQPMGKAWRAYLSEKLPDYMVPNHLIELEYFPLTPNGKIDRRALPEPTLAREMFVVPRTATEIKLAAIWREVLGVTEISLTDNFLELGGHSLLATQVIARVRDAFKVELPLRWLFESPTIADLAPQIESAQQASFAIEPISRNEPLPLSFAQRRLWFLEQLEGTLTAYNMLLSRRLKGELNVSILQQSLSELVSRHEILRSTFTFIDGEPRQVIHSFPPGQPQGLQPQGLQPQGGQPQGGQPQGGQPQGLPLRFPDLFPLSVVALTEADQEQEARVREFASQEGQYAFDLSSGPLMRATLLVLGPQEHILLVAIHHIICDEWSSNIFIRELFTLYEAYSQGKPNPLSPLPLQYADFAHWQQQQLSHQLDDQLAYWNVHLAGELPVLELPYDYPRPPRQTFTGRQLSCELSGEVVEALRSLSQREGVTLFMTLLTAFKSLLYRYTGQEDLIVGTPVAGRNRTELEGLIGLFVNTLVLRSDFSANPSFREVLGRVRQVTLDAYANQDVPFEKLVEALQPERDLSRTPIFQVWFNMTHQSQPRQLGGLILEKLPRFKEFAMFDLTLYLQDEGVDALKLRWVYNSDLFSEARIQRMANHFECLLESIVADPSQPIASLSLLTEAEQEQLLVEWGSTPTIHPEHLCIHELFEAQVRRTPNTKAVICEGKSLTYRELNARANQVAHYLQGLGVGPEVLVAICMSRSLDMVIGILGILKAGGAYLPLDPTYPQDRLAFMLEDAQVHVLLTESELLSYVQGKLEVCATLVQTEVLCIDRVGQSAAHSVRSYVEGKLEVCATYAQLPSINPTSQTVGENLVYVIYTSGSTGKPKGVMVTHANFSYSLQAVTKAFTIEPDDICLHTASIAFGSSARQLFAPLCQGATVVLASSEQLKDPWALFSLVKQQDVTLMELVPSHWRICTQVLAQLDDEQRRSLLDNKVRLQIAVGEPLSSDEPITWREKFNHQAQFLNGYGQTEARPVIFYPIPADYEGTGKIVPIGQPVANTEIYILDANLQPVPIGIAGEVHIGGPVIARGYLNQPELTAQKFIRLSFPSVAHSFSDASSEATARLYKTGDLARYCADGLIEFVGRKDSQVKLRGVRIELGEIEAILKQHPAVQEALALVRGEEEGGRLVAYIVTTQAASSENELRAFLKKKVPDYMIPSAFVFLPAMPLTPNGKIDRRGLPDPSEFEAQQGPISNWFYVPSWKRTSPLPPVVNLQARVSEGTWLLFVDSPRPSPPTPLPIMGEGPGWANRRGNPGGCPGNPGGCPGLGRQIAHQLRELGASVLTISVGRQFKRVDEGSIEINPTKRHDYDLLLKELNTLGQSPLKIVHLWSVTDFQPHQVAHTSLSTLGFYSLLYLAQALAHLTQDIQITVLSNQMQEVTGEEELCPEKATLLGPCRVIPLEYPNITCRSIDIRLPADDQEKLVEPLITELTSDFPEKIVAYREGERWVQYLERVRLDSPLKQPMRLREEGVYLITGGLGGIGLELASYLAQTVKAKLVLVSRSALDEEALIESVDDGEAHKIEKVRQLRQMGTELLLLRADVTNHAQMEHVIAKTLEHFGSLHGVIHAAGVRGLFETIEQKTPQRADTVLAAKVHGTRVLEDVLKGITLDFVLLCSSLASIVGRFGQVDYCAANAFLDAFALYHSKRGTFTLSINWDVWQELKMPVKGNESFAFRQLLEVDMQKGLLSEEGVEAFGRILASNRHQVIVTKRDILERVALIDKKAPSHNQLTSLKGRTPTEDILAAIWGEVLKTDSLGIHDNFFELGGHSLLAVQVISRIRQTFKVNFPLRRLFEFPTIAELSKVLQTLNESQADPIMPIPRNRVMPLSFGQRRLWDWQQLAGESAIYKISYFRILKGTLNLVALEQSFAELVSRHESLRTTFPVVEGQPIQFIHATLPVRLPVIDLQGFSKEEQELQMRRLAHENAYKPFDLAKGPLFRLALLRLGTEEHLLLLTFHHTIIDGWSRRRLFAQWATLYEAFLEGTPASLPEISLQYADFAYWQRHTQKEMAEGLAYWKEQLSGKIPLLDFPEDYPRPTQANPRASEGAFRGESQSILLSKALIDALKGLSQQEGCTFFMTMLAAFKALLSHKTGQEDIIIGSPNASRTRTELENVVGYFVNPLALRTSLQGNPTFRELLRRVRQTVLGAYTHQDVPFEKIVAELHPQRDLNRHPIFAVWFNMLNLEKQPLKFKGLTVEPVKLTNQPTAMFDFTLSISEGESLPQVNDENEGRLALNLTYKADLFSAVSMAQLLAEYQKLLTQIAQQPETRLFELFRQGIGVKRR